MSESTNNTSSFNIDFMGKRLWAAIFSGALLLFSMIDMGMNGLSLGLDFTGGSQLEVGFSKEVDLADVREVLGQQLYEDAVPIYFGAETEITIRFGGSLEDVAVRQINAKLAQLSGAKDLAVSSVKPHSGAFQSVVTISGPGADGLSDDQEALFPETVFGKVEAKSDGSESITFSLQNHLSEAPKWPLIAALSEATGTEATLKKVDTVGAQVGDELYESAVMGGLLALGVIMVYIALRFQFKFAVGAVAALAHDVLIVLGMFALFQWEFDLTVFAAVLATIGYSLNDTIVVSDRIRENFRKLRKGSPQEIINISLNQTLSRTVITSLTTLLVLVCLFLFGGESIHYFSLALIIGICIGTYSSIYVAASVMMVMKITKDDLAVPVKEGADLDGLP